MNVIHGKDFRLLVGPQRLKRTMIQTLLEFWGVIPPRQKSTNRRRAKELGFRPTSRNGTFSYRRLPESKLWDLYDRAKAAWRRRVLEHHPDRGGSHERCAELNTAWDRTRELFARLGIGDLAG